MTVRQCRADFGYFSLIDGHCDRFTYILEAGEELARPYDLIVSLEYYDSVPIGATGMWHMNSRTAT